MLERDSPALLDDAVGQSFDEFERRVRMWEALADPDGDRDRNERAHANRDVRIRPRPEGGWTITGNLAELIDDETFETRLRGETPDPRRDRDVVVRTQTGRRLHPDDAVNACSADDHARR